MEMGNRWGSGYRMEKFFPIMSGLRCFESSKWRHQIRSMCLSFKTEVSTEI